MSKYYVACDLGVESGRVMLGHLQKGKLTMSEVRRFPNALIKEKNSLNWDIPRLYQDTLDSLRDIGGYDEPVESISCNSWAGDYLLFESDGSLVAPAHHHREPGTRTEMNKVLAKIPWEALYQETGVQPSPGNTLCQLRAEKFLRLSRSNHLMPVADGFNYLLAGVPSVEISMASATQLYSPATQAWSDRLFDALKLPRRLFPPVVRAGTELGPLRPEIARQTGLEDVRIIASCSHEIAAALAGLPVEKGENSAFLQWGKWAVMGTELAKSVINDSSRKLNFTNEIGYGGAVRFYKPASGLWILEECQRYWREKGADLDRDMLLHLLGTATPFESWINPADPRFSEPGDMPLKIQAFCKETGQTIPRKPGPITRCILESLALLYRKTLREMEELTGQGIDRLYVLGGSANNLLNHFTANAVQIPVVVATADAAAIGNVIVQALALGHIKSLDEARQIVRNSFKMETIIPHASAWEVAYGRLIQLLPA